MLQYIDYIVIGPEPIPTTKTDPPIELATDPPTDPPKTQLPEPQTNPPKNNTQTPDPNEPDSISNTTAESPGAGNTTSGNSSTCVIPNA